MIMLIMRWLSDIARRISGRRREREQRRIDREARRRVGSMVFDAMAHRVRTLASREGIDPDALDDAVSMLASDSPLTMAQVLDQVDQHGLAAARDRIMQASKGDA